MAASHAAVDIGEVPTPLSGGMTVSLSTPAPRLAQRSNTLPLTPPAPAAAPMGIPRDAAHRFDLVVSNAPAAQVFLQLGADTSYNMLVSPEVAGSITVSLRNTTVPEALDTLRELFGYDFRITGNRVFVYPNAVQTRMFKIDYLPGRRRGASDLRVTSSSITTAGGGSGGSSASGSSEGGSSSGGSGTRGDDTSHVRMTSDADFWSEMQNALAAMVGKEGGRSVVLNPAAGVVLVRATPAELRQVESYLRTVQGAVSRQVMLEAKIIEVQLQKDAQTGVNWSLFRNVSSNGHRGQVQLGGVAPGLALRNQGTIETTDALVTPGSNIITDALGRGFYGLAFQSASFAALINFLQSQGDVQVLSSPRIATLNNQKAVLKVGSDELFVTGVTTNTTTNASGGSISSPTLTLQAFFSGISLDVTPQIDDVGNIMLHVHPAISVVNEKQKVIDLGDLGSFRLPLAASAINETDSIVRLKDGQIVAIGGLMRHEAMTDRSGVKGLSELPGVGTLFGQRTSASSKRELVILIKPTIIGMDGRGWSDEEPTTPMLPPPAAAGVQ